MKILTTANLEEWHRLLDWMPEEVQDIHYWPEMMLPYQVTERGKGGLLYDEHDSGRMIIPLLKRNGKFFHPFNFGGPISTPEYGGKIVINGPVYCTLNPFFTKKQQPMLHVTEYQKETVWVDLTKPLKFRQTTNHAIAKAVKRGAEFFVCDGADDIQEFADMYLATMGRNQADEHWWFDLVWFRSFMACLGSHATLCLVTIDGKPESGCILLHGYGTCYYHFAASHRQHPNSGVNHFMVAKVCEMVKDVMKLKRLHLGGGIQPRDGLFTFKSGFSDQTLPVYKYRPELVKELEDASSRSNS